MKVQHLIATALISGPAWGSVIVANYNYNGNVNWAPGGVASQTTTGYGAPASRAIDGIARQGFGNNSVTHTDDAFGGLNTWQVDLTATRNVHQVKLTNRGEGINNRLSNFRLSVLDAGSNPVWGQDYHTGGTSVGDSELFTLPAGIAGKFVSITQLGTNAGGNNVLSLAEVEVIENKSPAYPNVALTGLASQSSEGYGGAASRANDGNTDGFWGGNSVTHTDDALPIGNPVWLKIDLPSDHQINEIALFNRIDCCEGRLSNFRLSVRNDGMEVWGQDFLAGSAVLGKGLISVHEDTGGFFATGDEIRLELIGGVNGQGNITLSVGEFQAFGVPIPEPTASALLLAACFGLVRRRR
jgi:hypothetical protein